MLPPSATSIFVNMSGAMWLRTVLSPLPPEPPEELRQYFQTCDRDLTDEVERRAHTILECIFQKFFPEEGDSAWVQGQKQEVMKLYHRLLLAMVRSEVQRLKSRNVTWFLTCERFNRCLLACCAELVLTCHKDRDEAAQQQSNLTFPAIVEPTGLMPYDMAKVIAHVVRHEDTLPAELKRHLQACEERVLDCLAWQRGSSLYDMLLVARNSKSLAPEIRRLSLQGEPMASLDQLRRSGGAESSGRLPNASTAAAGGQPTPTSCSKTALGALPQGSPLRSNGVSLVGAGNAQGLAFQSPSKDRVSAFSAFASPLRKDYKSHLLQATFASPHRPNPSGLGTSADAQIDIFFRKVLQVAAHRIRILCEGLHQPSAVQEQVLQVVAHIVKNETALFFQRHMDQILLCSLYGVCKVSRSESPLTFKDILSQYRKAPLWGKPDTFRKVLIDTTKAEVPETGDIIRFYNEVFVPSIKAFLLQLGPLSSATSTSGMPAPPLPDERPGPRARPPSSPFASLSSASPKRVSSQYNIYVSPLRSSKADQLLSPKARQMSTLLGDASSPFCSPSKDLAAINSRISASRGRLGRLDFATSSSKPLSTPGVLLDATLCQDTLFASSQLSQSQPHALEFSPGPALSPVAKRLRLEGL